MNKELLDQLPADERAVAEKLSSAAETMKLSQSYQWNLETKLMDAYPSQNEKQNSVLKFLKPVGWVIAAVLGVLLVSWLLRTLLPGVQPAAAPTATHEMSFEESVRQGNSCASPLAVSHNFGVFITSPDRTQFTVVDAGNTIGELRSFTWSAEGSELLIFGNTTGSGNIYHADPVSGEVQPILPPGELGYMWDAAWSRDGKKVVLWAPPNNKALYVMNVDGIGLLEHDLENKQILGAPQFTPDDHIIFYGSDGTVLGLFLLSLEDFQPALVLPEVEGGSSFAFSPDGSLLAYMEYDHDKGEARLSIQNPSIGEHRLLGTFPIPKGSGSSMPDTANMSWSTDGKSIVFDVGRGANDRVIYLAHVDGTELIKVVEAGYAPAISSDGKCLLYMNNKRIFLLDLMAATNAVAAEPVFLADLPAGRAIADYRLDKLQWRP